NSGIGIAENVDFVGFPENDGFPVGSPGCVCFVRVGLRQHFRTASRWREQVDFPGTVEPYIHEHNLGAVRRPPRFICSHRWKGKLHLVATIYATSPQGHVRIRNVGYPLPIARKIDGAGGETREKSIEAPSLQVIAL